MTQTDVRVICRLMVSDFTSAYCHGGQTMLSIDGGPARAANKFSPVEKAAYMCRGYHTTPSLFAGFVRRHSRTTDPDTIDLINRCHTWCISHGYMPGDDT